MGRQVCPSRLILVALPATARMAAIAQWAAQRDNAYSVIELAARKSTPGMRVSGRGRPSWRPMPLSAYYGRNKWKALADRLSRLQR
jgi:hypothetical protein